MSQSAALERIQPCLFDRLVDLKPTEKQEGRTDRLVSKNQFTEGVVRDLVWLLNSVSHLDVEGLGDFPFVEKSVFNYGQKGFAGSSLSNLDPMVLEEAIKRAIRLYEPRIDPQTVKVRCMNTAGSGEGQYIKTRGAYNCLDFEISGELWAHPVPEEFFLKTSLDLETGIQVL